MTEQLLMRILPILQLLHVRIPFILCFLGFAPVAVANATTVRASIDATRSSAPVTRYEYGMFIEPIGSLSARSLWAEMLDDRKFYFPVCVQGDDAPQPPDVEGRPGLANRKWRPLGRAEAITMDAQDPYVGAQSVRIGLDSTEMRGISQVGIGVARGRQTVPVAVEGQTPQPVPKYPVGFDHPQVRAGSPTYPLDIIAGLSADGATLKIGVVNPTDQVQWLAIDFQHNRLEGKGREWRMTGATLQAANKVGALPGVTVTSHRARPLTRPLKIEPASTTVLEYPMRRTGR